MRVIQIVIILPFLSKMLYLLQIFKYVRVQYIFPKQPIEPFYICVLGRLPRLNILHFNISLLTPGGKTIANELWSIICTNG